MRRALAAALVLAALAAAGDAPAGAAKRKALACDAQRAASKRPAARRACRAGARRLGTAGRGAAAAPVSWRRAPSLLGTGAVPAPVAPAPAPSPTPSASPAPTPTPGYAPPPPPPDDPAAVRVSSTEFALTLSRSTVAAGDVRVEFDNSRAEDPHDLVLDPDGAGESVYFGQLGPGEVTAKTIALPAGTFTLFCSLLDHGQRGMQARLTAG